MVVFDECTYLKEAKAKRTKAAILLGKTAKYVIGLSGTPIINRPIEFFNILNLIDPKQFPSWFKFGLRYCNENTTVTVGNSMELRIPENYRI